MTIKTSEIHVRFHTMDDASKNFKGAADQPLLTWQLQNDHRKPTDHKRIPETFWPVTYQ